MKKSSILILCLTINLLTCFGQRSNIGIIMNGGFGSEEIPFFVDQYGNEITLSTGSGFSIGGEYGYDFSRSFNLSASSMFQISKISRQAKNADGRFTRMAILLTPSLSIPAKEDPYFRMLIGAGPGLYSFCTMKIDAAEAGGENMTLKYKPTIGFHSTILFLIKVQGDGYVGIGGKYYHIKYTFSEKGSTHFFNDDRINNPDGSGFGLTLGIYQRF